MKNLLMCLSFILSLFQIGNCLSDHPPYVLKLYIYNNMTQADQKIWYTGFSYPFKLNIHSGGSPTNPIPPNGQRGYADTTWTSLTPAAVVSIYQLSLSKKITSQDAGVCTCQISGDLDSLKSNCTVLQGYSCIGKAYKNGWFHILVTQKNKN